MTIITTDTTRDYRADIASANDGDTVLMRGGTYAPAFVSGGFFNINKAITLENYPGETPILTYSVTDNQPVVYVTAGATLRGLSIVGTYDLGEGIHFQEVNIWASSTALVTIDRCTLTKWNHCGIKAGGVDTPLTVQFCEIGQGGYSSLDHGIYYNSNLAALKVFAFNNIHHAAGGGVQLYNNELHCIIYGNVIHHNGYYGIVVTGSNHIIANNTIAANGKGLYFFHYGLNNLTVKNNIVYGNTTDLDADLSGAESITNSAFGYNDYSTQDNALMTGAGDISGDPLFLGSTTWLDYRLGATSPCRGTGTEVAGITQALDPNQSTLMAKIFGVGYDIGAFVYTSSEALGFSSEPPPHHRGGIPLPHRHKGGHNRRRVTRPRRLTTR